MNTIEQNLAALGPWTPRYTLIRRHQTQLDRLAAACRNTVATLTEEGKGDVTDFKFIHKRTGIFETIGWTLVMRVTPEGDLPPPPATQYGNSIVLLEEE